jgi:iron complex transport system substrate-binding protein
MIYRSYVLAFVIALLAACGPAPAVEPTNAPTSASTPAATEATAPVAANADATRTIAHALGESVIPAAPQRIVALNAIVIDNLVALGVQPAGVATFSGDDFSSYEYMAEALANVPIVGTFTEPNQERIAQLNPDLIIGREQELAETYATISQIAPTVALADPGDFRSWLRQVAATVGREDMAETRIADYEARASAARARIQDAVGPASAVFLRVQPDTIRVYSGLRLGGPMLYGDLGLTPPQFVASIPADETFVEISLEQIPQLADAEHIFLLDQSPEGEPAPLFSSPLWQNLPAVQAQQVYPVARDTWINLGVIAAERVIARIEEALSGTSSEA